MSANRRAHGNLAIEEALDTMFAAEPDRMRALMRGLSSLETASAILDAYDAIRAAGARLDELERLSAPPPDDLSSVLEELRRQWPHTWKLDQQAHLTEVQRGAEAIIHALPHGPEQALRAIRSFNCNLQKLKRGSPAYDLVKSIKQDLIPDLEYSLITEYYAAERATIFALLASFDALYRERKQKSSGLDYDDLEECAVPRSSGARSHGDRPVTCS